MHMGDEPATGYRERAVFIVRYSEVGIKGKRARGMMEGKIRTNFLELLRRSGETAKITSSRGRIFISGFSDSGKVFSALSRTMGVKSFSAATEIVYKSLGDIAIYCRDRFRDSVSGKKFAVRGRRNGGQGFTSMDLARAIGDSLFEYSGGVDLKNPDLEINVEVRDNRAYIFSSVSPGPGGLPIGSEGRVAALVSGGIDSPVAAWYLLKRGCMVDYVFISLAHPSDTLEFLKSIENILESWTSGYRPTINVIDGEKLVSELLLKGKVRIPGITYKRAMYEIARRIALEKHGNAIVTGESVGQVSSQTPANLMAINSGFDFPVFRPLIGMDKDEITVIARRIGSFPRTTLGELCSMFSQNVDLRADPEIVREDFMKIEGLDQLISHRKVLYPEDIPDTIKDLESRSLLLATVPEKAVVVDLRTPLDFREWHYEGAKNIGISQIPEFISGTDDSVSLVFYCSRGLQSAFAASSARKLGRTAYYVPIDNLKSMEK